MSAIFSDIDGRIATSANSSKLVPAAWRLPEIPSDRQSSNASSTDSSNSTASSTGRRIIDREEPCFITKSSCFTHQQTHWIRPREDFKVNMLIIQRLYDKKLIPEAFHLNHPSNLTNLDRVLRCGLRKYNFFAVTGSFDTLTQLIKLLDDDNTRRQAQFNRTGVKISRKLNLEHSAVVNAQYELVALYPRRMLPNQKTLVTYAPDSSGRLSHKVYVVGQDDNLREYPGDLSCPRIPPFSFDHTRGSTELNLNPFIVILDAETRFRQYRKKQQTSSLPAEAVILMDLTTKLVESIDWEPPNTPAAHVHVPLAEGATLQERLEYGQYLLSGRNLPDSDEDSDNDEDFLEEYDEDKQAISSDAESHIGRRAEEVREWRNTIVDEGLYDEDKQAISSDAESHIDRRAEEVREWRNTIVDEGYGTAPVDT